MLSVWSLLFLGGCIDPYEPPVIGEDHRFLVVEGFITSDDGASHIRLSRTARLADSAMIMPERNAQLQLEGEDQSLQRLQDNGGGLYSISQLKLQEGLNYRLRIHTANGAEYLSDPIKVKRTPPIDSLSWSRSAEGVQIYVSTHDPENATTYYLWDYKETWEFDASYFSTLEYIEGQIVPRDYEKNIYTCWQYDQSRNLFLGSSAKLSEDIIYKHPLGFVPAASWKLSKKYSVQVRQYALSKEAFEYFQQMKKNSELGGSIFAPQPTELSGNMHNLNNPGEPVIGYVGAYTVQEHRMYIEKNEVPDWGYKSQCELINVPPDSIDYFFGDLNFMPLYLDMATGTYPSSKDWCADCTLSGSPDKPDFWE